MLLANARWSSLRNTSARQPKSDCSLAVGEQVGRSPRGAGCPISCRQRTDTEYSKPATREDPPRRMAGGDKTRPQRTRQSKAQYRADHRDAQCRTDLAARGRNRRGAPAWLRGIPDRAVFVIDALTRPKPRPITT